MKPTPLLILSDSPSCTSGLGRITRDLATRIHANMKNIYRVGTIGYGGPGSTRFGWPDYHMHSIENWMVPELPLIAEDFAQGEELILLTIWDASRVGWIADPRQCPMPHLRRWLESGKVRKWTYTPVDAEGVNGKMTIRAENTLKGFERVLNYSKWSAGVTGYPDSLPHGVDDVFRPRDKKECRRTFIESGFMGLKMDSFLVGIVATNQSRKDWGLGMQTVRLLLNRGMDVKLWCHTDALERYWDLGALVVDYGLQGRVVITTSNFSDEQMSGMYAACDVTLGIGLGEGFGFPIFESLGSGTACVHGRYGGAPEYMPEWMVVDPVAWRWEGPGLKRPVMVAEDFAAAAVYASERPVQLAEELRWGRLWPRWEKWLRDGVKMKGKLERMK